MKAVPLKGYQALVGRAVADPILRTVLRSYQDDIQAGYEAETRAIGGWDAWRDQVAAVRRHTVAHLDYYLEQFTDAVEGLGGSLTYAADADEARRQIAEIVLGAGARMIVKSKSMMTEEIGLNPSLESLGIEVVETDLGEYIIQLAGERPAHIVGPALLKTVEDIAELFSKVAGRPLGTDPDVLAAFARKALREKFLLADVGISGCNFGVAATGSVILVTSEGNGRMTTSLPKTHIVVMGLERLVPDWESLDCLLTVLPRAGVGGAITTYVSAITGPRRPGDADGPENLHVVVVDNGRSQLLGGEYEAILQCVRCGACLDFCPVFRHIGGHSYGPVYSGPMGAVLTPLLGGLEEWGHLPFACSLCGACDEICSARIPLTRLLLRLRQDVVATGLSPKSWDFGFRAFSEVSRHPQAYRFAMRAVNTAARVMNKGGRARLPVGPLKSWTATRDLPQDPRGDFLRWWQQRDGRAASPGHGDEGMPR